MSVVEIARRKWGDMRTPQRVALVGAGAVLAYMLLKSRSHVPPFIYAQGSAPWGAQTCLGGPHSMADVGCFLTSLDMAFGALTGSPLDPGDVNSILQQSSNPGFPLFIGDNLVLQNAAEALGISAPESERLHEGTPAFALASRLSSAVSNGVAVVNVGGTHSPTGNNHFMLAFGRSGGGYLCADPARGEVVTLNPSTMTVSPARVAPNVVGIAPVHA